MPHASGPVATPLAGPKAGRGDDAGGAVSAGDMNGDGLDDLTAGAPRLPEAGDCSGAAPAIFGLNGGIA